MTILILGKKGSGKTELTKKLIKQSNLKKYIVFDANLEYTGCFPVETAEQLKENIEKQNFPINFFSGLEDETAEVFNYLFEYKISGITLVIDEAHLFQNSMQKKLKLFPLLRLQRHRKLNFIFISQRPADIHKDIYSQLDKMIVFKQTELRDLETLGRYGVSESEIKALPEYQYIIKTL